MAVILLIARLALAAVFGVAGVAKLRDRAGTRRALREFGVPARLATPAGVLLPIAELSTAVVLVPVATAWGGAVAALALLVLFTAGVGTTLLRGRHPDCNCFGQVAAAPISWRTLARNVMLAAVAGLVVAAGRDSAGTDVLGRLGGSSMNAWVGVGFGLAGLAIGAVVLWLLLQMIAQNGRLLLRLEQLEQRLAQTGGVVQATATPAATAPQAGLPVGAAAPAFQLPGLHGEVLTLGALRASGKPTLLAFMDPGCGPCNALLPDVARWQRELAGTVSVAVISRGSEADNRVKQTEHGLTQVLLQQDREVASTFQANGTPSMVLVRPDGTIGSSLAEGAEQIRALVARTMGTPQPLSILPAAPTGAAGEPCPHCGRVHAEANAAAAGAPRGIAIGSPAPALSLPDLEGATVDLADFRGRETVVLFWNPGCGFCQQMLPDLKAWETRRPAGAPAVLVVSSGTTEAVRGQGLASTVLLDPDFKAGPGFGANGTPMAVRVDATGNVASEPVAGAEAVFQLLGGRATAQ